MAREGAGGGNTEKQVRFATVQKATLTTRFVARRNFFERIDGETGKRQFYFKENQFKEEFNEVELGETQGHLESTGNPYQLRRFYQKYNEFRQISRISVEYCTFHNTEVSHCGALLLNRTVNFDLSGVS